MDNPLVQIDNLSIGYQTRRAGYVHILKDLSLTLPANRVFGLVGESGSGKSTLALALFGYLNQDCELLAGTIHINGTNPFRLDSSDLSQLRRDKIALVPQFKGQALNPSTRVGKQLVEKLTLSAEISAAAAKDEVLALMSYVKLPAPEILFERYPHQLSEGQHQRTVIAMALLGKPDLLVLDEPTAGLDVTTQAHILETLKEISGQSTTSMLLISHDIGVIANLSDQIGIMYAGKIIEEGDAKEIFAAPAHPYTRGLLNAAPRLHDRNRRKTVPGQAAIPGTVSGCAFSPRCQLVTATCLDSVPPHEHLRGRYHLVSCHHWHKTSPPAAFSVAAAGIRQPKASDSGPIIDLKDVAINYHEASFFDRFRKHIEAPIVVDEFSLTIQRGETVALIGESGSGKSTIANTIAGLHDAFAGQIYVAGQDISQAKRTRALRQKIQIIFQNPGLALNPRLTISQMLDQPLKRYFPSLSPRQRQERKMEILSRVKLGTGYLERYPRELSNGEIQRAAIARAFIAGPALVLCDEITSALDSSVQSAILTLLEQLQAETNCGYLFITHDLAIVRSLAHRVAVLYLGRLCQIGQTATFFTAPMHPYCEALLGAVLAPEPGKTPRLLSKELAEIEAPAAGCPFQNRCHHHQGAICNEEAPPWRQSSSSGEQSIRCHIPLTELTRLQSRCLT